ncbi:MAG: hypothetical protein K5697_08945 [Lachnospiraceae bacterium]|nr:hypothetical protein [Lachnospiraceae bacterium]
MNKTGYEDLSQVQLHTLFSSGQWSFLSFEDRMNACQEVENRYAAENHVAPCTVVPRQMDGGTYGWQSGRIICLNESLVKDGCFSVTYTDENQLSQTSLVPVEAPNWNVLDTVYHEGTHGIQESLGMVPDTYVTCDTDRDLYRIQKIEKEAYAQGQNRTLQAIGEVERETGLSDPEKGNYVTYIRNDSFQSSLRDAELRYNDPDIENTLAQVIYDRDYGIIPKEPSESYQIINRLCDEQEKCLNAARDLGITTEADGLSPDGTITTDIAHGTYLDLSDGLSSDGSITFIANTSVDHAETINDGLYTNDSGNIYERSTEQGSENSMEQ